MIKLSRLLENTALPLSRQLIPNPPEGMSNFILDVGVQLGGQQTEKEHQGVQCLICSTKKQYPLQKTRGHIGYHFLNNDIVMKIKCSTQLHKTSAPGGHLILK